MRPVERVFPLTPETFDQVPVRHPGSSAPVEEAVAEEVPIALEYNGVSHVVMFATPADLEDFALGFSLTEGILTDPKELFELEVDRSQAGITLSMRIASERFALLKERRRTLTGRTGCGLCGTDNLAEAVRPVRRVTSTVQLAADRLHAAFESLRREQRLLALTGAVHAAAWMDGSGSLSFLREDVGRHNALDKMLGAAIQAGTDFGAGAAIITSRASFEMVHKVASMNIGLIAAISAPTALAIRTAQSAGLALVGFVRGDQHAVYCGHERLIEREPATSESEATSR